MSIRLFLKITTYLILFWGLFFVGNNFAFAQGPPEENRPDCLRLQDPEFRGPRGMMGSMPGHWHHLLKRLNLSPEQVARLQELREAYLRDTLAWRNELVIKRYDLRDLLRNPLIEPSRVLEKQREISSLESKIQERSVLYQIEMRKVLTPEQRNLLPPDFFSSPFPGQRMRPWRGGLGRE